MIEEGRHLASLAQTLLLTYLRRGLAATHQLASEGIRINPLTLIFSAPQALLAAKRWRSLYRLLLVFDDIGEGQ